MTVPSTTSAASYTGTGTTDTYPVTWSFAQAADLVVYTLTAAGVLTKLALTTDYTVSGAGVPTGGTVTLVAGNLASGTVLFIASDPAQVQQLLLQQGAAYNPADVMNALDLLTREIQATRRVAGNAIQIPLAESLRGLSVVLPAASQRASKWLGFDALGNITALAGAAPALPANVYDASAYGMMPSAASPATALQAAVNAAANAGGGVVYIPSGTYTKLGTEAAVQVKSNVRIVGAGRGATVLKLDDTTGSFGWLTNPQGTNISNVSIESLTLRGIADVLNSSGTPQIIQIESVTGLVLRDLECLYIRKFGLVVNHSEDVLVTGCHLRYVRGDGIAVWNSSNVRITFNNMFAVEDDSVSCHVDDVEALPRIGVAVIGNTITECQGVKILGAKDVTISHNVMHRMKAYGVYVGFDTTFNQGNTPNHTVSIVGNVINDVWLRQETNPKNLIASYMFLSGGQAQAGSGAAIPGRNNTGTGTVGYPYGTLTGYFEVNNTDSASVASPGGAYWIVADNIMARTLPSVAQYSDWGYGQLWTYNNTPALQNPAMPDSALDIDGITLQGAIRSARFARNVIAAGQRAIFFNVGASCPALTFDDVVFEDNFIFHCLTAGFMWPTTGTSQQKMKFERNTINCDPWLIAAARGSNGTWSSSDNPSGVYAANLAGCDIIGNHFKNCNAAVTQQTNANYLRDNVLHCDPAIQGFDVTNKGIGNLPRSGVEYTFVIEDCDPTSATFGQTLNTCIPSATAVPNSGKYMVGHFVLNTNPVESGTAGSKYIVIGWVRRNVGSGNVLNTDWSELRCLTGN